MKKLFTRHKRAPSSLFKRSTFRRSTFEWSAFEWSIRKIGLRFTQFVGVIAIAALFSETTLAERQRVDETREANADGYVRVKIVRGDVEVSGWDKNEVKVTGLLDEQTEKFIFETSGSETTIVVKIPNGNGSWFGRKGSDLTIKVPKNSEIDVSTVSANVVAKEIHGGIEVGVVSGNIDVTDVLGRINLTGVSSNIDLRGAKGKIKVSTVSGEIEARNVEGPSVFHTVSGEITVREAVGEFELETVSGDIELLHSSFESARGHTVSGDIEIEGRPEGDVDIEFDTISGSVRLELLGDINAKFDLETASGDISNRLSDDRPKKSKYMRDERLRFTLGKGEGSIDIVTRSGDIVVTD